LGQEKPKAIKAMDNFNNQYLGVCFKPYSSFTNLQTLVVLDKPCSWTHTLAQFIELNDTILSSIAFRYSNTIL